MYIDFKTFYCFLLTYCMKGFYCHTSQYNNVFNYFIKNMNSLLENLPYIKQLMKNYYNTRYEKIYGVDSSSNNANIYTYITPKYFRGRGFIYEQSWCPCGCLSGMNSLLILLDLQWSLLRH